MKYLLKRILRALFYTVALSSNFTQTATLKVYNMSDRAMQGFTNPKAPCQHGRKNCSFYPYQSIFHSNSVTFELPGQKIDDFYWKGIVGPLYKIRVDLQQNERATIELHGDCSYKYKNNTLQYAETVK